RYELAETGRALWPAVHALLSWGFRAPIYKPAGVQAHRVRHRTDQPRRLSHLPTNTTARRRDARATPRRHATPPRSRRNRAGAPPSPAGAATPPSPAARRP